MSISRGEWGKIASFATPNATTKASRYDTRGEWISREVITVSLSKTGNEEYGRMSVCNGIPGQAGKDAGNQAGKGGKVKVLFDFRSFHNYALFLEAWRLSFLVILKNSRVSAAMKGQNPMLFDTIAWINISPTRY